MKAENKTREQLLEELAELRQKIRIFELLPLPATLIDTRGFVADVNPAFLHLARSRGLEIRREDRIGGHIASFASREEERTQIRAYVDELVKTGEDQHLLWSAEDDSGYSRYWDIHASAIKDEAGRVIGALVLRADITDRKQSEEATQINLALQRVRNEVLQMDTEDSWDQVVQSFHRELKRLVEFNACSINLVDLQENRMTAYAVNPGRGIARNFREPVPPAVVQAMEGGRYQYRRTSRDPFFTGPQSTMSGINSILDMPFVGGTLAVNSLRENAFSERDIRILEQFGQVMSEAHRRLQDIAVRRQAEEEYRTILRTAMDGFGILDTRGNFLDVNDAYCRLVGYRRNELLTMGIRDVDAQQTPEEIARSIRQVMEAGCSRFEVRQRCKDGRIVDVEISTNYMPAEEKFFVFLRDITDRKRMEEDLRRAHNLESLGVLAGGIAHDFNNILTGVVGNLDLLLRFLDRDSTEYEIAGEARQAAMKTRGLTQQLMTFARGGTPVKETASIEELLRETTHLSLRGAKTRPEFHFAADLSSVEIDVGQIGQVIQNLVINADQAMPNGGTLRVAAENVEIAAGDPLPLEPGTYVRVSVEDQGIGIPEKILSQVFDPYFSTKETGHGLGLSISYSIIHRHSGHITVSSRQGVGTTFEFYLPASEKPVVTATESERDLACGTGKILVMDDEDTIHRLVSRTLRVLGYEVESACDGEEALQMYEAALESGDPFDIVIMDLTIPGGMGGKEAVGKLREIDPLARAIVASGYANDPVMANFAEYGFAGRVAKPIDIEELADTVKSLLEGY